MKYVLSVSELAKLRNVTSEALRHYDRIGILKPDHIQNKHRYYSIRQYEKLGTIIELRQLGMSLMEIQEYFANRNVEKSIYLLQEYQKAFEKRLQEQMQLNTIMLEKLEFLKSLQDLPAVESVFEVDLPMRHMLTFGSVSGDSETHAMHFTRLEGYLNEKIPILASDRVGVYADESILLERDEMSLAIPMILVTPEDTGSEYLKEIPAGRYVCMYYHNGTLEKYDKSFEIIKAYIREKGYQICGSIIQLYKVDVTLTDDRSETIMEIQIPVCFT